MIDIFSVLLCFVFLPLCICLKYDAFELESNLNQYIRLHADFWYMLMLWNTFFVFVLLDSKRK